MVVFVISILINLYEYGAFGKGYKPVFDIPVDYVEVNTSNGG